MILHNVINVVVFAGVATSHRIFHPPPSPQIHFLSNVEEPDGGFFKLELKKRCFIQFLLQFSLYSFPQFPFLILCVQEVVTPFI